MEVESYYWEWGDGQFSTEAVPNHVYIMAGIYTWTLTVTLSNGIILTNSGVEYVYANNYNYNTDVDGAPVIISSGVSDEEIQFSGLQVSRTNRCFRFGIPQKIEQGIGWSEYDDVYEEEHRGDFPYPMAEIGYMRVRDENEAFHMIVVDSRTFRMHEMGLEDQWRDGEDDYGGSEIEAEVLLREHTPPVGASAKVQHEQTHSYVKPWYKDRRNTNFYNSEGFRTIFEEDVFIRENSEPTDFSITKEVPIKGQLVFDRKAESENLQIGIRLRAAPWRLIQVQTWFRQIDSAASPNNKLMSEMQWALELSEPEIWLARNINPLINAATGAAVAAGTFTGVTTGPDGVWNSGVVFVAGESYTIRNVTINGDFTWMCWLRSPTLPMNLFVCGNLVLSLIAGNQLRYADGIDTYDVALQRDYDAWALLSVVRSGSNIIVRENRSLTNTVILPQIVNASGNYTHMGAAVQWSDMRLIPRAISAGAVEYVQRDFVEHSGNSVCPII